MVKVAKNLSHTIKLLKSVFVVVVAEMQAYMQVYDIAFVYCSTLAL